MTELYKFSKQQELSLVHLIRKSIKAVLPIAGLRNVSFDLFYTDRGDTLDMETMRKSLNRAMTDRDSLEACLSDPHAFYFQRSYQHRERNHQDEPEIKHKMIVDEDKVFQVLMNVLMNAIKFAPDHTVIQLHVFIFPDCATVSVSDQGPGVPPEEMPLLFQPFSQLRNHQVGGSGLGLNICRRLSKLMDGDIWLDGQEEDNVYRKAVHSLLDIDAKGATFHLRFPYKHPLDEGNPPSTHLLTKSELSLPLTTFPSELRTHAITHYSFLIVEDNFINQIVLKKVSELVKGFNSRSLRSWFLLVPSILLRTDRKPLT